MLHALVGIVTNKPGNLLKPTGYVVVLLVTTPTKAKRGRGVSLRHAYLKPESLFNLKTTRLIPLLLNSKPKP